MSESSSISNPLSSIFSWASWASCASLALASAVLPILASCLIPLARAIFPLHAATSLLAALVMRAASIGISGRSSSSSHAGALPSLSPLNGSKRKRLTPTLPPCSCGRMRTRALPSASTESASSSCTRTLASPSFSSSVTSSRTVKGAQYSPCAHGTYSPLARLRAFSLSSAASLFRSSSASTLACTSVATTRAASFTIFSASSLCASSARWRDACCASSLKASATFSTFSASTSARVDTSAASAASSAAWLL